jgi:hypothetical protein
MTLSEYENVVRALGPDRWHPALGDGVGLRRSEWRAKLRNTNISDPTIESSAMTAVAVTNEETRRHLVVRGISGIDIVCEQCHLPCMTDKTTPAGWVVQLTIPAQITPTTADGTAWIGPAILGAPSLQYFNVAIADAEIAVEATRKHSGSDSGVMVGVVRALSAAEVASIPLSVGEVKRAWAIKRLDGSSRSLTAQGPGSITLP